MQTIRVLLCLTIIFGITGCSNEPNPTIPQIVSQQPVQDTDAAYINFSVDSIKVLRNSGDTFGDSEFRMFVIASDTEGHSTGMFCPGGDPIKVKKNTPVDHPCVGGLYFREDEVGSGVFIILFGVDEDKKSGAADLANDAIASSLATALSKMVTERLLKNSGKVLAFGVDLFIGVVSGGVEEWIKQADIMGSEGVFLSRANGWDEGKYVTITGDGGLQITYTVSRSVNPNGVEIASDRIQPISQPPTQSVRPTATISPTQQVQTGISDPGDFARWYFTSLWKDRDFQSLWDNYLTQNFRNHASDGSYQKYVEWWNTVTKIDIESIDVINNDGKNAWIHVKVTFHLTDGRVLENREYDYDLTFNQNKNTWMFDYHY